MEGSCRSCGGDLKKSAAGAFCARCLFGTAMAELAGKPDAATPDWREMAEFLPQYEFVGEIGRGGMGTVYEAVDPLDGKRLAVKVLAPSCAMNPELVERFRREAEVMETLRHERIVSVRHCGERAGLLHLVMEFVPGGDLARRLRERGPVELDEAVRLIDQAAEGVEFSHAKGVLHRDLKPGNLLLDENDGIKVGDFGLAKVLGRESDPGLTLTNASMGTPRYMAPEQLGGADSADERSDVYALGVVFYELLTGQLPGGNFALPSERVKVGEQVDEWVLRALSDDPGDRFQSVGEARAGLARLVKKSTGRWRWAVLPAAVLALTVAVLVSTKEQGDGSDRGVRWLLVDGEKALPAGFPKEIDAALEVRLSDARRPFGVALLADGSLRGFGDDSYGQASPPEGGGFMAIAVARGEPAAHGLALRRDGTVVAWGDDSFGQTRVPEGLAGVTRVQAGELWSAAEKSNGEVLVWGRTEGLDPEEIDWEQHEVPAFRAIQAE